LLDHEVALAIRISGVRRCVILLGSVELLFDHLDGGPFGYKCVELLSSPSVVHVGFTHS
jgi:hypothetical protein